MNERTQSVNREDQRVEQPAIGLFAELGWTTASALEESLRDTGAETSH